MADTLMPASARLIIGNELAGEDLHAVKLLESTVHTNPDALDQTIDLFREHPEVVGRIVDYLYDNPENLGIVAAWRRLSRERLDAEVEFDEATEDAIAKDPYFQSVKREFDLSNDFTRETLREKVRARRWRIFIGRVLPAA